MITRKATTLILEGAEGVATSQNIEQVLGDVPGVLHAYADPVTVAAYIEYDGHVQYNVYVEYDADRCGKADLTSAVESLGVRVAGPEAPMTARSSRR